MQIGFCLLGCGNLGGKPLVALRGLRGVGTIFRNDLGLDCRKKSSRILVRGLGLGQYVLRLFQGLLGFLQCSLASCSF